MIGAISSVNFKSEKNNEEKTERFLISLKKRNVVSVENGGS